MKFRPCIDIHNGKVKQIVGGSLKDQGDQAAENFVSEQDAAFYAELYKKAGLKGGHVILLNGKDAGLKYLSEEGSFFYPEGAERNKEAEEFLKASVEAAVETGVVKNGDREIFVETYEKNPRLIILGGGHVSLPVAEIGRMLGFHVTVMDDREEFVTEERFPMADERIFGDFDTLSDRIPPYENAYYVEIKKVFGL